MNFNDWFLQLQTRTACNRGAGLVAFKALLARLNNPQKKYKIIHVAGTNGKGTVCTLLARVLVSAGKKTGLFISPHLISPTERIQLDGKEITPEDLMSAVEKVLAQAQEPLNLFEILTAASLVYFAEKKAQYVVLETGLGGRKDPTNVCVPVLSILTSIGLDHTHILGDSLEKIAFEKAGIIKPGVPVLCGYLPPEAARVVQETAREKNAPLEIVCTKNPSGNAQEQNKQLVHRAANLLGISGEILPRGLEKETVPGRFEIFSCGKKTVILDGAHNPPAMENLLAFWRTTPFAQKRAAVLCAFMQDKDYPQMLAILSAHFKAGIVTAVSSPKFLSSSRRVAMRDIEKFLSRAAGEQVIAPLLPPGWEFISDVSTALTRAQEQAEVILVTGSFYLVGEVRKQLIEF